MGPTVVINYSSPELKNPVFNFYPFDGSTFYLSAKAHLSSNITFPRFFLYGPPNFSPGPESSYLIPVFFSGVDYARPTSFVSVSYHDFNVLSRTAAGLPPPIDRPPLESKNNSPPSLKRLARSGSLLYGSLPATLQLNSPPCKKRFLPLLPLIPRNDSRCLGSKSLIVISPRFRSRTK